MLISTMPKAAVVPYVADMLQDLESDYPLIMITTPEKSEDSSARTVIAMSSEDIADPVGQNCLKQLTNILYAIIRE